MPLQHAGRIAIILVNYNGAADTIECLGSILTLEQPENGIAAIVVDNGSSDGSVARLRDWLQKGKLITESDEETAADFEHRGSTFRVILIQSATNGGFAAGCNAGLARAVRDSSITHFWLLNNDTTVAPQAALELLASSRAHSDRCISGSTLLYYDHPDIVQAAAGARYIRTIGRSYHFFKMKKVADIVDAPSPRFDYIVGASMFFSRAVLESIGYLPERYFLYAEETDWCTRARRHGIALVWARNCFVFHKEGRSTGANQQFKILSDNAYYYVARNNLLYIWDNARLFTVSVTLYTFLLAVYYSLKGDPSKLSVAWRATRDFWRLRTNKNHATAKSVSATVDQ